VLRRVVQRLVYRTNITCQRKQDYDAEVERVKKDLLSNACTFSFVNSAVHKSSKTRNLGRRVVKPVYIVSIADVKWLLKSSKESEEVIILRLF
jgi:hypothetical protein